MFSNLQSEFNISHSSLTVHFWQRYTLKNYDTKWLYTYKILSKWSGLFLKTQSTFKHSIVSTSSVSHQDSTLPTLIYILASLKPV